MLDRILNRTKGKRKAVLRFRVTAEEAETLRTRGEELGLNRSEYLRFILDQVVFNGLLRPQVREGRDAAIEAMLIMGAASKDQARIVSLLDQKELHRVFGELARSKWQSVSSIKHNGEVFDVSDLNPTLAR